MLAILRLEVIGDDTNQLVRELGKLTGDRGGLKGWTPWVARITGTDHRYKLQREFVQGDKDYSNANSVGSRGVELVYWLEPGVYEVYERTGWSSSRRYFVWSAGGQIEEIDADMANAYAQHLDRKGAASQWTPHQQNDQ